MFPYLFLLLLMMFLAIDLIFLPKSVRRAWVTLFIAFSFAATMVFFPEPWSRIAIGLHVGRPVDILIYTATVVLMREMFLARARRVQYEAQLTEIARELAMNCAQVIPHN